MQYRGMVLAVVGLGLVGVPVLVRAGRESPRAKNRMVTVRAALPDTAHVNVESTFPTRVSMRNVDFRVGDGVVLRIRSLEGSLRSLGAGVIEFDDRRSYRLMIDTAEVGLNGADITNLLNRHVFAYPGAPLRNLTVQIQGSELRQSGTLRKGVDIPFTMTTSVSLTPDQRIRLHPTKMRIFGVNGMKLMSALGLSLQKMLNLEGAKGVTVEKNDLLLSPLVILPPPAIGGHIAQLRVVGGQLVQVFGASRGAVDPPGLTPPDTSARNYMFYRGGTLHFGKLYMTDAELLIVDRDDGNAFDFDNIAYQRQLVAGSSRTLPDLGLEVYMPDAGKVAADPPLRR